MTRLFEAPHGWVADFLQKASAAGLTAEHLRMLNADPHLLKGWVASLPSLEPVKSPVVAAKATDRVTLKDAFGGDPLGVRILGYLNRNMKLAYLDEVAAMCDDELKNVRGLGPVTIERIRLVLEHWGMRLSVHPTTLECPSFVVPFTGWVVMRAKAGGLKLDSITSAKTLNESAPMPTVNEFRAMSDEERKQLFDAWTIRATIQAIDAYRI